MQFDLKFIVGIPNVRELRCAYVQPQPRFDHKAQRPPRSIQARVSIGVSSRPQCTLSVTTASLGSWRDARELPSDAVVTLNVHCGTGC